MLAVAVKIHSDNEGMRPSQGRDELGFPFDPLSGAIAGGGRSGFNVVLRPDQLMVVAEKGLKRPEIGDNGLAITSHSHQSSHIS